MKTELLNFLSKPEDSSDYITIETVDYLTISNLWFDLSTEAAVTLLINGATWCFHLCATEPGLL